MPPAVPPASRLTPAPPRPAALDVRDLRPFVTTVFGEYAHAKRLASIANASAGVLHAASCASHAIGAAYAALSAGQTKQVDRLLSNAAFDVWGLFEPWVRFVNAEREAIVVALDGTDFEKDDHNARQVEPGNSSATSPLPPARFER